MLYYGLEHRLKKEQLIISNEKISESPFALQLKDGTIFAKDIAAGSFDTITVYPTVLFNFITVRNLRSQITLLPKITLQKAFVLYTPFYPLKVFIQGESNLGSLKGEINLQKRAGFIDIFSKKSIPFFKEVEKGRYRYEFRY